MTAASAPDSGQPPRRNRLKPRLVECPYANDLATPKPLEVIPPGTPKPDGVVRGDGEAPLMANVERRRLAIASARRLDARIASYGRSSLTGRFAPTDTPTPIPMLVPIQDTTILPYRHVALLEIIPKSGPPLQGSGWLAGPNLVITAGHCVYQRLLNSWALSIRVHLAVNGTGQEEYDVQESHNLQSVGQWTDGGEEAFDFGGIILPTPFNPPPGNFGYNQILSDADLQALLVTLLGYPAEGTPDQETMWGDQGFLGRITPTQIFYVFQSVGGMSGGPVFFTVGEDRYVVGIHNYGGGSFGNYATRLTEPVQRAIYAWAAKAQSVLGSPAIV